MEKENNYKEKAYLFKDNNISAYIKDIYNNFYFCNILDINDIEIKIYNFTGKREGKTETILFIDIISFKKYKSMDGVL